MHRTALLATAGGLDRAHFTACSSRELYRGTYQGRKNGQTDRQMEGHIGGQIEMHSQPQMDPSYVAGPFPVLHKCFRNTGRKGAGPVRLQMDSNIVVCPATPNFMSLLIAAEVGSSGPD